LQRANNYRRQRVSIFHEFGFTGIQKNWSDICKKQKRFLPMPSKDLFLVIAAIQSLKRKRLRQDLDKGLIKVLANITSFFYTSKK